MHMRIRTLSIGGTDYTIADGELQVTYGHLTR